MTKPLQMPRLSEPSREVASKLEVIRAAARLDLPTADIDRMLEEIEQGYGSSVIDGFPGITRLS